MDEMYISYDIPKYKAYIDESQVIRKMISVLQWLKDIHTIAGKLQYLYFILFFYFLKFFRFFVVNVLSHF